MRVILVFVFMIVLSLDLSSQSEYVDSCHELISAAYSSEFSFEKIDLAMIEVLGAVAEATGSELESCNCADSIWVTHLKDFRQFGRYTHSVERDTSNSLRSLSSKLDSAILNREFTLENLGGIIDTLDFVIDRLALKEKRRDESEYSWMTFYHCIEAESGFLKTHQVQLRSEYLEIFDNIENPGGLRDLMLHAFFYSDQSIEMDVLCRIEDYLDESYFYRMLGILMNNGGDESVKHLLGLFDRHEFDLNETKAILQAIYNITDRVKLNRKTKKEFQKFLESNSLDTLTRYDLFIREE